MAKPPFWEIELWISIPFLLSLLQIKLPNNKHVSFTPHSEPLEFSNSFTHMRYLKQSSS